MISSTPSIVKIWWSPRIRRSNPKRSSNEHKSSNGTFESERRVMMCSYTFAYFLTAPPTTPRLYHQRGCFSRMYRVESQISLGVQNLECGDKSRAVRGSRHRFPARPRQSGVARDTACRRTPDPFAGRAADGSASHPYQRAGTSAPPPPPHNSPFTTHNSLFTYHLLLITFYLLPNS